MKSTGSKGAPSAEKVTLDIPKAQEETARPSPISEAEIPSTSMPVQEGTSNPSQSASAVDTSPAATLIPQPELDPVKGTETALPATAIVQTLSSNDYRGQEFHDACRKFSMTFVLSALGSPLPSQLTAAQTAAEKYCRCMGGKFAVDRESSGDAKAGVDMVIESFKTGQKIPNQTVALFFSSASIGCGIRPTADAP